MVQYQNWIGCSRNKHLENNPLYGIFVLYPPVLYYMYVWSEFQPLILYNADMSNPAPCHAPFRWASQSRKRTMSLCSLRLCNRSYQTRPFIQTIRPMGLVSSGHHAPSTCAQEGQSTLVSVGISFNSHNFSTVDPMSTFLWLFFWKLRKRPFRWCVSIHNLVGS